MKNSNELKTVTYPECAKECSDIRAHGCTICDETCMEKLMSPVRAGTSTNNFTVRIKPTDNPHAWYRDHVGATFEVTRIRGGFILAQEVGPTHRCISAKDCEVVDVIAN